MLTENDHWASLHHFRLNQSLKIAHHNRAVFGLERQGHLFAITMK